MLTSRLTRFEKPRLLELSTAFVDEAKSRADIGAVIGADVALRKMGSSLVGLCPFHSEKSPSFNVNIEKQVFHCFGCKESGDVVSYLMKAHGKTFRETILEIAADNGLALPEEFATSPAAAANLERTSDMAKVNALAAEFYRHCFDHGKVAKDYLLGQSEGQRKVQPRMVDTYLIGYAPPGWKELSEVFKDYASNPALLDAGLVIETEADAGAKQGNHPGTKNRYDRFRDRLMFGIRDHRGRVLGFGGRCLDGSEPKYLNSPESALFSKGHTLFGLYEAKEFIRKRKQVIVCEGYMDVVALAQAGFEYCVASMGTACTSTQIERLCTMSDEVIFCFDGDKAGQAAAWKALQTCLPFALDTRTFKFLVLPDGLDPDEFIQKNGEKAFELALGQAVTMGNFLLQYLRTKYNDLVTPEDKAKFAHEGLFLISKLPFQAQIYRILRSEFNTVSSVARPIATGSSASFAKSQVGRSKVNPWSRLERAAKAFPGLASHISQSALEQIPENLQEAFFEKDFEQFELASQGFWKALYVACETAGHHTEGASTSSTPAEADTAIERDLLNGCCAFIAQEMHAQQKLKRLEEFRAGSISDKTLLSAHQHSTNPV
jgi:DNA primase